MSRRSRASIPSMRNPASQEMISDSVELRDTAVCFLHIQLEGTNVRLPKIHKTPPDIDFESSRSQAKSESWNKPVENAKPFYPHDNIVAVTCVVHVWNQYCQFVCHKPQSIFATALASLLTTIERLVFQLVPRASISKQIVSILVIILRQVRILTVWTDVHPSKDLIFWKTASLSCLPIHNIAQRIFEHVLPSRRTKPPSLR